VIRLLCACCLLWIAAVAQAADPLVDKVRSLLQQPPVVSGRFEQVRELSGFPKPVASRGHFIVARERGVLWQTEAPFVSSVRLTRSEILQKAGDTVTMRMSADKEPAVRAINGVMFALLSGDIAQLEQRFTVTGKAEGGRWALSLVPARGLDGAGADEDRFGGATLRRVGRYAGSERRPYPHPPARCGAGDDAGQGRGGAV